MQNRVIIRRARPHAIALAIALLTTALAFYLLTLIAKQDAPQNRADAPAYINAPRVTAQCAFAGGEYAFVYIGKETDATRARITAARRLNQGAAGYIYSSDGFYYALGNAYTDKNAAESDAARINAGGVECAVIEIAAPTLNVRFTAAEAQIAALQNGYRALIRAEDALRAISEKLDSGAFDAAGARSFAAIAEYELKETADALRAATPDDSDAFCLSLRARVGDAVECVRALARGTDSEMYLSARIKHARIQLILSRLSFLSAYGA